MEFHELANLFPLLTGDEYIAFRDDIAANGQHEPIWIHDGQIIDGRNRYIACLDLGIEPQYREWDENGSLIGFIISLNLHRRHLSSSQKATLSVEVLPLLEAENSPGRPEKNGGNIATISNGKNRDIAAEMFQVSPRYVQDAKTIQKRAPELFEKVKDGEITIPQAKREIVRRERKETPPLPTSKYRVLYADPPWQYNNSGIIGETDHYGHTGRHYPSMSIPELCAFGEKVRAVLEDNAVLFMWVTSPLLEECFPVIKAWGFQYKASFVWDKQRHNFGHYNSVRHEFLLICTRGSCTPDISEKIDSVVSEERSDVHSEKPEIFRNIIDRLYTHGNRLELFARIEADGWDAWGNEPC